MKTRQEIFDTVATHLLKQNAKALDDAFECVYRNEEGLMCAVGCLIPIREYKKSIEGFTVGHTPVDMLLQDLGIDVLNDKRTASLLSKLQLVHDEYQVETWLQRLTEIAYNFNLNIERLAA